MKKYLIVTADDLGLSQKTSEGIIQALNEGHISDVSILAVGAYFPGAVSLLKNAGKTSCGVHLCFIDKEKPLTPAPEFLLEGGFFPVKRLKLISLFLRHSKDMLRFLERELSAQIERVLESGLSVTHLDGHQHLHLLPGVQELTVKLAKRYEIAFVRVPVADRLSPASPALAWLGNRFFNLAEQSGLRPVRAFGFKTSGRLTSDSIEQYMNQIKAQKNDFFELMTHPGFQDEEAAFKYAHWDYHWERELEALNLITPAYLESKQIQLVDFAFLSEHVLSRL